MTETKEESGGASREFVAFRVGEQEYCVDIMAVREIRGWTQVTVLPHAPDFMRGVINLRGSVLPIVDLATRMGLRPPDPTERHVIIVSQVGSRVIGLLVDAVSDILTVLNEQMQPTPEMAQGTTRGFVEKVVAIDGRMIRLVDLERVLPPDEEVAA